MAQVEFGTGKSVVVLAIVLGCFAILWPKIFYPMMQTAFAMTSPKMDTDENHFGPGERPPHIHPGAINARAQGAPTPDDIHDKFMMREGRPFPNPQSRQPPKVQQKSGGAMSIIMPIYTVGIVVFFLYTVLKLVFKKPEENSKKPLIKDFHMDPEYRKFVCQQPTESAKAAKMETKLPPKTTISEEVISEKDKDTSEDNDSKDFEIHKLKLKLEETEQAMERIIKHMGAMNQSLSDQEKVDRFIKRVETNIVRQRHKKKSKPDMTQKTTKQCHVDEREGDNRSQTLEQDLEELISLCNGAKVVEKAPENVAKDSSDEDFMNEKYVDLSEEEDLMLEKEESRENAKEIEKRRKEIEAEIRMKDPEMEKKMKMKLAQLRYMYGNPKKNKKHHA